jgi:hypothetical protein
MGERDEWNEKTNVFKKRDLMLKAFEVFFYFISSKLEIYILATGAF